ncbi:hypothetical protein JW890_07365 [candidate division WOR-3 bacterium]|nr:hypothetical protein [candidate division WOR-3 bacterium]
MNQNKEELAKFLNSMRADPYDSSAWHSLGEYLVKKKEYSSLKSLFTNHCSWTRIHNLFLKSEFTDYRKTNYLSGIQPLRI